MLNSSLVVMEAGTPGTMTASILLKYVISLTNPPMCCQFATLKETLEKVFHDILVNKREESCLIDYIHK